MAKPRYFASGFNSGVPHVSAFIEREFIRPFFAEHLTFPWHARVLHEDVELSGRKSEILVAGDYLARMKDIAAERKRLAAALREGGLLVHSIRGLPTSKGVAYPHDFIGVFQKRGEELVPLQLLLPASVAGVAQVKNAIKRGTAGAEQDLKIKRTLKSDFVNELPKIAREYGFPALRSNSGERKAARDYFVGRRLND